MSLFLLLLSKWVQRAAVLESACGEPYITVVVSLSAAVVVEEEVIFVANVVVTDSVASTAKGVTAVNVYPSATAIVIAGANKFLLRILPERVNCLRCGDHDLVSFGQL